MQKYNKITQKIQNAYSNMKRLSPIIGRLIALYMFLVFIFNIDGIIPSGTGLGKSDWLEFTGAFLAFAGTTVISYLSWWQSTQIREFEKERLNEERFRDIQPIITISLQGINRQVPGTAEAFSLNLSSDMPKHSNFILNISNQGKYPIQHVIVGTVYWRPYILPSETVEICGAFTGSIDIARHPSRVIEFDLDECNGENNGYPETLVVNYEDIDGNEVYQAFEVSEAGGKVHYSHQITEKVMDKHRWTQKEKADGHK